MEIKVIKADPKAVAEKSKMGRKKRVCAYCRVSTNSDEQQESFESQVRYYTEEISRHDEWENAGIFADEGITGTSADKRPQFMKMIGECMAGKIDMVLVKSISRFARNTVDTLKYVRALREKNVAIIFEEEHIDTSDKSCEFFLTVLSSLAQQEVQNTSEHVKKGLDMKMSRGELVGFNACLGYDYDKSAKKISVNEGEAKIVKYIFTRYVEGAGTTMIGRELEEKGWKTARGSSEWHDSTILGILKNEKYKGDLLQGKTYTVDPITGRRLTNNGESDRYYVNHHHEAIIPSDVWEKANEMLKKRSYVRKLNPDGTRSRFSREYDFSSLLECGFCHHTLCRRKWSGGHNYSVLIWQCSEYSKHGKFNCPDSKGMPDSVLRGAFIAAYNHVIKNGSNFLEDFIKHSGEVLQKNNASDRLAACQKSLEENQKKIDRIGNLFVDGTISEEAHDAKYKELSKEKESLLKKKEELDFEGSKELDELKKLEKFKDEAGKYADKGLESFSLEAFDTCISKVIVGGYEQDGTANPYRLTFIFKKGFGDKLGQVQKGSKPTSGGSLYPLVNFDFYWRHSAFVVKGKNERRKVLSDFIPVVAAIELS